MTPPKAPNGNAAAVSSRLDMLRTRAEFLAAARGQSLPMPGFVLQARDRGDTGPPRVGFTCSRKVGNAVARNRAKRRLREIARLTLAPIARPGWDYVLVGRRQTTADMPFERLQADLDAAARRLHGRGE